MGTNRDFRTMNMTEGQKIESDQVMKRLGDLSFRNFGSLAKMGLFDEGKTLIIGNGLRVAPSTGMTVSVPSGVVFQRNITNGNIVGCIQTESQTVTLDAASGSPRIDIIEGKITAIEDKDDLTQTATVASGTAIAITNEIIQRDIKYYLSVRKQTNTTTPTAATTATLTGTVAIPSTVDLSEKYLLNLAYGEDGSYQEIDLRGVTPEATTAAEIISNINAAVGVTAASVGGGDVVVLEGEDDGDGSYFEIKPPVTDSDKDALETVFGVSIGGVYRYTYRGVNAWSKIAEIDVGASTTTITADLIRNINRKNSWASDSADTIVHVHTYSKNDPEWNQYDSTISYAQDDPVWIDNIQFVSQVGSNQDNYPVLNPASWRKSPKWDTLLDYYQDGYPVSTGGNDIDNPRSGNYRPYHLLGYYRFDDINYEAWKVHLDGATVTGDTDLENILDGYYLIDTWAPDNLGTRTLTDTLDRVPVICDSGSSRAVIGATQDDQGQGHNHSSSPANIVRFGSANIYNIVGGLNGDLVSISIGAPTSDGINGTPRIGTTTREKTYSIGVPYIVVIKAI